MNYLGAKLQCGFATSYSFLLMCKNDHILNLYEGSRVGKGNTGF